MNDDLKIFAENLKLLRDERGYTLRDLAIKTGISKSMLQKYETGTSDPTLRKVKILADIYNVSINWLIREPPIGRLKKAAQ